MATNFKPWAANGEYGTHYLLDKIGDGIGMHSHVPVGARHDVRCLAGSVAVYGDGLDAVLHAGERLAFKSYRLHEIAALEPATEIVNVLLNGPPPGYGGLDEPNTSGSLESILLGKLIYD